MPPTLIIITGTPCTGKSTLAIKLARELGCERLDLHPYYPHISNGYNIVKQAYNIDPQQFIALVKKKIKTSKKGLIIDSHISHLLPPKLVDLCIVLRCSNLKELRRRLHQRKYSLPKIRENLDAEIFDVCLDEAQEQGHQLLIFDTPWPKNIITQIKKALQIR